VDRIIFCVFLGEDLDVYRYLLPRYFPSADKYDQEPESIEQQEDANELEEGNAVKEKDKDELQESEGAGKATEKSNKEADKYDQEPESIDQQEDANEEGNAVKEKDKDELQESEGEGKATENSNKEEEAAGCLGCRLLNVDVFSVLCKIAQNCFQHFSTRRF